MENLFKSIISDISILVSMATLMFTIWINKRQLATKIVTQNRIEWIKAVRTILGDFACEYMKKEQKNDHKLWELKTRVELFMRRDSEDYCKLLNYMELCCTEKYSYGNYEMLMYYSTYILNRVWRRIVIEGKGGIMNSNKKIVKLVDKDTKKLLKEIIEREHNLKRTNSPSNDIIARKGEI